MAAKPFKPGSNFIGPTFPEDRKMQTAPLSSGPAPSSPNFMGPTFPETRKMQGGYVPPKAPMDPMNPTKPSQMPGQPQVDGNAMAALFATMGANQLQQQREYLADRRIKGVRRDMRGNVIDETTGLGPAAADPFKNGFFKTRAERIAKEAEVFGTDPSETSTAKSQSYLTPAQVAQQMRKQGQTYSSKTVPSINYGPDQDPAPFKGQMMPLKNAKGQVIGEQYMLNPNLPDDKRFKAENFAEARFGIPTAGPRDPKKPTISDEKGPQVYPPSLQIQGYPEGPQQYNENGDPISTAPGYQPYGDAFSPKTMKDMATGILPRSAPTEPVPVKPNQPKKKK